MPDDPVSRLNEALSGHYAIERELAFTAESGIPHISRYDIREFIY